MNRLAILTYRSQAAVARSLASSRSLRPRPAVAVAVLIVALVGAALLLAAATGSLGIPHNDDWSFSRTALTFVQTGQLRLSGWGQMFLLGQVVTSAPLLLITGPQQWTLQLYGALAAVLLLVCTYLLAGRGWRAVALVATVAVVPGFALWTTSYMTDLPAAAAALLALVLAVRAARLGSVGWLVAALLAGFWAFTIRETMVGAVVAAVLVIVLPTGRWRSGAGRRLGLVAVGGGVALMVLGFVLEGVRHSMTNADAPPYRLSDLHLTALPMLVSAYFTVGLGVAPLVLWAAVRLRARDLRSVGRWIGWALGLAGAIYVGLPLTLPNHLDERGAYWDASVGGPVVGLAHPIWVAVQVLAAIGGVGLAGEIGASWRVWRRIREWDPARIGAVGFGLVLALVIAALTLTGQEQWDRYVLALVPCVGVALLPALRALPARAALAWLVPVLLLGAVSWSVAVTANLRDARVWAAARQLVAQGIDPRMINAGLDWNGYHSNTAAAKDQGPRTYAYHGQRWTYLFADTHDCWIVSLTPLPEIGDAQLTDGVYVVHRPTC